MKARTFSFQHLFSCSRVLVPTFHVGTPYRTLQRPILKTNCNPKRKTQMARTRYKIYQKEAPHFLTCTTVNWLPLFSQPEIVDILFASLKFLQDNKRLLIFSYIIMENHLHLIASSDDLSKEIGIFKSYTARQIIDYLKAKKADSILRDLSFYKLRHKTDRDYQVWQEDSHPQMIQGEKMMRQKIEYIHFNPVKRNYVENPEHWLYSSARNYAGLEGRLEICKDWF